MQQELATPYARHAVQDLTVMFKELQAVEHALLDTNALGELMKFPAQLAALQQVTDCGVALNLLGPLDWDFPLGIHLPNHMYGMIW